MNKLLTRVLILMSLSVFLFTLTVTTGGCRAEVDDRGARIEDR